MYKILTIELYELDNYFHFQFKCNCNKSKTKIKISIRLYPKDKKEIIK